MITLVVGIVMGAVATVFVNVGFVLLALSRARRFGPLRVVGHAGQVALMFDEESRAGVASTVLGAPTMTFGFSPETARRIAERISAVATEVESDQQRGSGRGKTG